LDNYNVPHGKLEMAGNNVCFDRQRVAKYMPTLHDHFHYRNLDISSFKVSCSRLNPEVFDQMKKPESIHRPLSCIAQSVAEYNFYIDNFLFVSDEHRD
jgi:oligoribonuclease